MQLVPMLVPSTRKLSQTTFLEYSAVIPRANLRQKLVTATTSTTTTAAMSSTTTPPKQEQIQNGTNEQIRSSSDLLMSYFIASFSSYRK